jgi:2-aminoadipate transaminase
VLEDDWLGELREEAEPRPLKARADTDHVLYLGTVSKVLFPGLRIGWLVAPKDVLEVIVQLKRSSDLATNTPGQVLLEELLRTGAVDAHVTRVRAAFDRRRSIVQQAIEEHFPPEARPRAPFRGMVLWIDLPERADVRAIVAEARRAGVEIPDGRAFEPDGRRIPGFRISYATADEKDLAPAIETLGHVLRETLARQSAFAGPPLV